MPYSERLMKDRKAVGRLRYNVRKFLEAAKRSCGEGDDYRAIAASAEIFLNAVDATKDFDDDGTPIVVCTCLESPRTYCHYCGH